jgi:hypothetical protein
VVALLDRLPVEEGGEAGQGLRVVVDRHPDVLLRGAELVRDLLVQRVGEALVGHGPEPIGARRPHDRSLCPDR